MGTARSHGFVIRLCFKPSRTDLLVWQPEFGLAEFGLVAENIPQAKSTFWVCLGSEQMTLLDPRAKWQTDQLRLVYG